MDENWRKAFGIFMCREICDGTGVGKCDVTPSTCPNYTHTGYDDKIHYNDNLNVMKPSLKRGQLMRNYAGILH